MDQFLTSSQAAALIGVARQNFYAYVRSGRIKVARRLNGKSFLYDRRSVESFARRRAQAKIVQGQAALARLGGCRNARL
jgi:predicted site-specific integrase-resolvase